MHLIVITILYQPIPKVRSTTWNLVRSATLRICPVSFYIVLLLMLQQCFIRPEQQTRVDAIFRYFACVLVDVFLTISLNNIKTFPILFWSCCMPLNVDKHLLVCNCSAGLQGVQSCKLCMNILLDISLPDQSKMFSTKVKNTFVHHHHCMHMLQYVPFIVP